MYLLRLLFFGGCSYPPTRANVVGGGVIHTEFLKKTLQTVALYLYPAVHISYKRFLPGVLLQMLGYSVMTRYSTPYRTYYSIKERGLSRLLSDDLHWLTIPQRVQYKLVMTVHRSSVPSSKVPL